MASENILHAALVPRHRRIESEECPDIKTEDVQQRISSSILLKTSTMRLVQLVVGALIGVASAAPAGHHHCLGSKCAPESDALTAQGLENLKAFVAKQGYTNSTCTLEKAAIRKEWCVPLAVTLSLD